MKLVTAQQMRALDQAAIKGGIASLELMERAGAGLARAVHRYSNPPGPIGIVLGSGNNAGDGLVAARHLQEAGYQVELYLSKSPEKFSSGAMTNWQRLQSVPHTHHDVSDGKFPERFAECNCLIDALLGTGLTQEVRDPLRRLIIAMNGSGKPIIAADIPSGLSADTGQPLGEAVQARHTVTFGLPKLGLVLPPGPEYVGDVEVVDIGIPPALIDVLGITTTLNTPDTFQSAWPQRKPDSHKGDYGHAGVIAGSRGMIGAGFLTSQAVLRSGAGLVTYALAAAAYEKFDPGAAEVMVESIEDGGSGYLVEATLSQLRTFAANKQVIAIGPGLGREEETVRAVRELIATLDLPCVIDADALFALSDDLELLAARQAPTILTPHPGEMARLCGKTTDEVQADRLGIARSFATTHQVWLLLKGYRSIIAAPDGTVMINPTGDPGMATAGAGDVLTGILAGLIAQGMPMQEAASAGAYVHGLAGDLAAAHRGETGMVASDIIDHLPEAITLVQAGSSGVQSK